MPNRSFEAQREAQRAMIRRMLEHVPGSTPSSLAASAGLAASTLTRFLNQDVRTLLTARTINKLLQASGLPTLAECGDAAHQEEECLLLRIWRSLDVDDRIAAMRVLESMARAVPDQAKRSGT